MATTHLFQFGKDQAVQIPDDMAYADDNIELIIVRSGDVITIYPKQMDSGENSRQPPSLGE